MLTSWSDANPEAAARWPESSGLSREGYLGGSRDWGALFDDWFREDSRAAIQWLIQLEDTIARRQVSALAAPRLATRAPKSLFDFLEKLHNELERSLAIADVRTSLRGDDSGGLTPESKVWVDWLLANSEGPLREAIFNRIKWTWGRIDPDGMRSFVESMPSGSTRIYRAESFASIWAQTEPKLAVNWGPKGLRGGDQSIGAWADKGRCSRGARRSTQSLPTLGGRRLCESDRGSGIPVGAGRRDFFHWSRFGRPAATEFAKNEARFPDEIRQEVIKRLRDWELPR